MMFKEELAAQIVRGEKTQTSRVLSDNPRSPWYRNRGPAYEGRPATWRYPVGKRFTINPGRGVPRVAECEVTARFRSTIGAVIYHDFADEGFPSAEDFKKTWATIHPRYEYREAVDVVRFKVVGAECPACRGDGLQPTAAPGPLTRPCFDCYGTGVIVTVPAVALIAKLGREEKAAHRG